MNWLEGLTDDNLLKYKLAVEEWVRFYDGYNDELYEVWKTLLKQVWDEEKCRSEG